MRYFINSRISLLQPLEGPLARYLNKFADAVNDQGYTHQSAHYRIRLAADFSRWLMQQGVTRAQVRFDHPHRFLQYRSRQTKLRSDDKAALRHFMDFLAAKGLIAADKKSVKRLTAIDCCIQAYERYLYDARGLAEVTVVGYSPFVRCFLENRFGTGPIQLSSLRASDIVEFVLHQAPRLHRKRAKKMTTVLRSFFTYTRYCGKTTLDLTAAVPVVPNWSMPSIPRAISSDQVTQLLASMDRSTAPGLRDYAILMLFARLGLRLSEVTYLELDDIDWNSSTLNVRCKGGTYSRFPLPHDVGQAIAAYLQSGRPVNVCRRVFLRTRAPIQGFHITGVNSIVRRSLERYHIQAPTNGAHQFRHGLATEMLRQGASLGEIGDVLGHRHPQTTTIYTKVDIEALRTLALPWPGAAS